MPGQLIYASVPAGRAPGRSGYCTVARTRTLSDRLVSELERLSAHEPGRGEAFAFRTLTVGREGFAVITRYADAGPDYTGRASTLAQHLVFSAAECADLPPPADIARRFSGWKNRWDGPPAWIDESSTTPAGPAVTLPAARWKMLTGDAGHAASLCDEAGRACPGTVPTPDARAALDLFAESALLCGDRGWLTAFSTRDATHDPQAGWRTGPARTITGAAVGRRAVQARSGALPGARPETGYKPRTGQSPAIVPLETSGLRQRMPVIYAGAAVVGAGVIAALVYAATPAAPKRAPQPPQPPARPPAPAGPRPAVMEAMQWADRGDWFAFHQSVEGLTLEERQLTAVTERISRLRRRLIPDTLARLAPAIDRAPAPLPAPARGALLAELTQLENLAAVLRVPVGAAEAESLATIRAALSVMEQLDTPHAQAVYLTAGWGEPDETPLALSRDLLIPGPGAASEFLASPHGPIDAHLTEYRAFAEPTTGTPNLKAAAKDFVPGRILVLHHARWGKIIELRTEANGRTAITLRSPRDAGADLPDPSRALALELRDTGSGQRLTLIFLPAGVTPNPLIVPQRLLQMTTTGVTTPDWLTGAFKQIGLPPGGARALLPAGYESGPRDYPPAPVSSALVKQALLTRLHRARTRGEEAAVIQNLESRLAEADRHPIECGSPWSLVVLPPGATAPLPLIRFAP